ncbi:hypothetical protein D3C76_1073570 [compost metagenome]
MQQQLVVRQEEIEGGEPVSLASQHRGGLVIEHGQQRLLLPGQLRVAAVVELLVIEAVLLQQLAVVVLPGQLLPVVEHQPGLGGKIIGGQLHQETVHLPLHQPLRRLGGLLPYPGQQGGAGGGR